MIAYSRNTRLSACSVSLNIGLPIEIVEYDGSEHIEYADKEWLIA